MEAIRIIPKDLVKFSVRLLTVSGVDGGDAQRLASILVWNDRIGRFGQGVYRIPDYLVRFRAGQVRSPARPETVNRHQAIAVMDGGDGFGHCVAEDAIDLASELAGQFGVGLVSVRRSNHFGAAAYYVNRAAERGELGLAFSNARARVAAYGGASPLFGTNPLSFGAPLRSRRPILVDLSTGAAAMSSVRLALAQNKPISPDLFVDNKGNPITDPSKVNSFSTMRSFGGARGYCLALMVEVLSAVLSQAALSTSIPDLREDISRPSGTGHLFLVIKIEDLLPLESYYATMDELVESIHVSQPLPGFERVDVPGDARWRAFDQSEIDGIPLNCSVVKSLSELARDLGVDVPWESSV